MQAIIYEALQKGIGKAFKLPVVGGQAQIKGHPQRSDHARRAGYHRHRFQIESTWRLVVPRAQQRLHSPDCAVRVTA